MIKEDAGKVFEVPETITYNFIYYFVLFLILEINNLQDNKVLSSALINKNLPNLDLEQIYGDFSIKEILGKESFVINFFASWCAPCRIEHDVLLKYNNNNIIIAIAYKDKVKNTKLFLKELGNPYDILLVDKKGRAAIELGLYVVPESYFIDKNGKIRYRQLGPLNVEKFENIMHILKY